MNNTFNLLSILNLPDDVINIINKHCAALIIQETFRTNRDFSSKKESDRVLIILNNKKKYGTIVKITKNNIKIQYLRQMIPNWKKSNILYWKCFKSDFPYYIPKIACINVNNTNIKIIKLNNWKSDLKINNKLRIKEYYKKTMN